MLKDIPHGDNIEALIGVACCLKSTRKDVDTEPLGGEIPVWPDRPKKSPRRILRDVLIPGAAMLLCAAFTAGVVGAAKFAAGCAP